MAPTTIPLAKEVGRVPSRTVPLNSEQEKRFQRLVDESVMVNIHDHPMVLPKDMRRLREYLHSGDYTWGYEAVKHGGWAAVGSSNGFRGGLGTTTGASGEFEMLADEIGMMITDLSFHTDVAVRVSNANEILSARQQGKVGFLPTAEHLSIGNQIHRLDVLYGIGIRLAGLTYSYKTYIGDGCYERTDAGLSEFGMQVVSRMNDLGMAVDLSHAGHRTALEAIEHSQAPVIFSHNAAYTLRQTKRTVKDEALTACVNKGGIVCITAVPNSLSDDPNQDINCVLDQYDYMVKLVGVDHVGIGTDTLIGDHVAFSSRGITINVPNAPYLNGLESTADGKNILRGLITRGYSDADVTKIVGGNALAYLQRVLR
jgi:membrane dipeptidase